MKTHTSNYYLERLNKLENAVSLYNAAKIDETQNYPKNIEKHFIKLINEHEAVCKLTSAASIKKRWQSLKTSITLLVDEIQEFNDTILNDENLYLETKDYIVNITLAKITADYFNCISLFQQAISNKLHEIDTAVKERKHQRYVKGYTALKQNPELYRKFLDKASKYNNGEGKQYANIKAKKECVEHYKECQRCNSIENLEAHHLIPIGYEGSTDTQDNLICLCRSCHQKLHYRLRQGNYSGLEAASFAKEFITNEN